MCAVCVYTFIHTCVCVYRETDFKQLAHAYVEAWQVQSDEVCWQAGDAGTC